MDPGSLPQLSTQPIKGRCIISILSSNVQQTKLREVFPLRWKILLCGSFLSKYLSSGRMEDSNDALIFACDFECQTWISLSCSNSSCFIVAALTSVPAICFLRSWDARRFSCLSPGSNGHEAVWVGVAAASKSTAWTNNAMKYLFSIHWLKVAQTGRWS